MKKLQVIGWSLTVAIVLGGCFEKKDDTTQEIEQIKKEGLEQEKNQGKKPKTEAQKKLDEWWKEKAEVGRKSKAYQLLDIHNN